jgi:uncharacterized protein (TIGR02646 family)
VRAITKSQQPNSLVQHRKSSSSNYDNYLDKDTLRLRLVKEQRGICCYCMARIRPDKHNMKVEHWHSQDSYPLETLDYPNLLGACTGNEGEPPTLQHCDTSKGNQYLSRNPANVEHQIESFIRYGLADGAIYSQDPQFDRELNEVLHLNLQALRNRRLAAVDILVQSLPKKRPWSESLLRKALRVWSGESHSGDLEPYCQIVVDFLRRRLDRVER